MYCSGRKRNEWGQLSRCGAKGKVERKEGWYCLIHDPERIAARNAAQDAKWKAEQELRVRVYQAEQDAKAILKAVAAASIAVDNTFLLVEREWGEVAKHVLAVWEEVKGARYA